MSAKRFGAIYFNSTTVDTFQTVMTGSAGFDKTALVTFCNQTNAVAAISLAYVVDPLLTTPAQADYLMFYRTIKPYESIEIVVAVESEARLLAHTNVVGISVVAHGYQDASV